MSLGAPRIDPDERRWQPPESRPAPRLVTPPVKATARIARPGSLPRGRRLRDEVPEVPPAEQLTELEARAQEALRELVEAVGGRFDSVTTVPVDHLDVLTQLCDRWGRRHGVPTPTGFYFSGQPGLRHALDELYPLQDPNRWDRLREAVINELEKGSWRRRRPPRGSVFDITA
jgi:hypothetical protein